MCTLYIYGTPGFAEKLNIQNCKNSSGYCVHYICTECLDFQTNWIFTVAEIQWKIVYIIHVQNVWIGKKIECPLLRKCNKKLCMLYIYGMSGLAKKLNAQNCKLNRKLCTLYVRKVWICRKIQYPELRKYKREIVYVIYVQNVWISKKI